MSALLPKPRDEDITQMGCIDMAGRVVPLPTAAMPKRKTRKVREYRCVMCSYPIAEERGICGECACEDESND